MRNNFLMLSAITLITWTASQQAMATLTTPQWYDGKWYCWTESNDYTFVSSIVDDVVDNGDGTATTSGYSREFYGKARGQNTKYQSLFELNEASVVLQLRDNFGYKYFLQFQNENTVTGFVENNYQVTGMICGRSLSDKPKKIKKNVTGVVNNGLSEALSPVTAKPKTFKKKRKPKAVEVAPPETSEEGDLPDENLDLNDDLGFQVQE
jgi:hypothetical protein